MTQLPPPPPALVAPAPPPPGFFRAAARWVLGPYLRYAAGVGARQFMHPPRRPMRPSLAQLGLPGEALTLQSDDGTPLAAWYLPAARPSTSTVVLSHGHGNQCGEMLGIGAKFLHAAGYNLVAFDFRNAGASGGSYSTMGYQERHDVHAAVDEAVRRGATHIGLFGVSLGGAAAIEEAADDPRVRCVVADSPFDSLEHAILPRVRNAVIDLGWLGSMHYPFAGLAGEAVLAGVIERSGLPLTEADPINQVPRLSHQPLLLIHGLADDETPPACSERLYAACREPEKALVLVPGARHVKSHEVDPVGYQRHVLGWLARSL